VPILPIPLYPYYVAFAMGNKRAVEMLNNELLNKLFCCKLFFLNCSEDGGGNPLVSRFQDDLDGDEDTFSPILVSTIVQSSPQPQVQ